MKRVILPDNRIRPLPFYLAMEEYCATHSDDDLLFIWQVEPTVIFGRNQHIDREVDLDYCLSHGIQVYRRKSGGGCVYADKGNFMISYIVSSDSVVTTFSDYTSRLAEMLRRLGLDAHAGGRNDVMIGDRKVSGGAFYHTRGRSIVHSTMLHHTDIGHMTRAISPPLTKLTSKGVESVRSRITTVSEHCDIDIDRFGAFILDTLCPDSAWRLSVDDVTSIEALAKPYFTREWIYGHNPQSTVTINRRIDNVGEFEIHIATSGGRITDIDIMGDFFLIGDLGAQLIRPLTGVMYTRSCLESAIKSIEPEKVIHGLSRGQLLGLLL